MITCFKSAFSMLLMLATVFPCHVCGQGDVQDGLLLHYDFNDRQQPAVDRSGNGHDGEMAGATWRPVGIGGGALYLRGPQDGVRTSDSRMPLGDSPRSFSCWISLDHLRQSVWTDILYYGTRANNQMAIMSIDWRLGRDCPDFSQWGGVYLSGRRLVQEGVWHHLVLTYNGNGQYAYYINGELWHGTSELHGKLNTQPGGTFAIGSHHPEEIHSLQGYIDEVRVYNRALSEEEAVALFREGSSIAGRHASSLTLAAEVTAHQAAASTSSTGGVEPEHKGPDRPLASYTPPEFRNSTAPLHILRIGFSTHPEGDRDVTVFSPDEAIHVWVEDVDMGSWNPDTRMEMTISQFHPNGQLIRQHSTILEPDDKDVFAGKMDLKSFAPGIVQVDIAGFNQETLILLRSSWLSIQRDAGAM